MIPSCVSASMPGVKAVYTRQNIGKLFRTAPAQDFTGILDERRPPFEDDTIRYYGQYVAAAVALTFEQAVAAANAVNVTYNSKKPDVRKHLETDEERQSGIDRRRSTSSKRLG